MAEIAIKTTIIGALFIGVFSASFGHALRVVPVWRCAEKYSGLMLYGGSVIFLTALLSMCLRVYGI